MRSAALFAAIILGFGASGFPAAAQEVKVAAFDLSQVENPSEIDRWRVVVDSSTVRAVGDAITSYYGCVGCYSMVGDTINMINSHEKRWSRTHRLNPDTRQLYDMACLCTRPLSKL
jgi:hypothetical protein